MKDFITLTCPSCGGSLDISKDIDRFACGNCGKEHVVKRGGGTVSLAPIVEGIKKVERGVDKTASELAIVRLEKKINQIEARISNIANKKSGSGAPGVGFMVGFLIALISGGDMLGFAIVAGIIAMIIYAVVDDQKKVAEIAPLRSELAKLNEEKNVHVKTVS